jgi:hypothetical protein
MVLFSPRTIRLIFVAAPLMIVVVLLVVVGTGGLLVVGSQNCRRHRDWHHKGGT